MKRFEIGPGLKCDLESLVNTRLLVQANSGAGKSWLLRRILEQSHGHIQHLVIDPEGEFSSLREKYDYVLAAKSGGDTLADPRVAKILAERLLELGVSAILDIYELNQRDRVQFVKLFCNALVDAPKALWHPVLVIVDEAHVYCPEKGEGEAGSSDAVQALCTRGRKRGFCPILATQRLSKLHKSAAAECNNKLIGRSSLDTDMKRASNELGFNTKEQMLALRNLAPGEFFAFGPALSHVVKTVTVGEIQTQHPKAGSRLAGVVPPPTDKVKALLPKLSDLPAEAEAREKTVAELRKQIAELKKELATKPSIAPAKETRVEVPVLKDAQIARLEKIYERMLDKAQVYGESMALLWGQQSEEAKAMLDVLRVVANVPKPPPATVHQISARTTTPQRGLNDRVESRSKPPRPVAQGDASGSSLPPGEHATLTAALQYEGLDRKRLSVLTGYKRSSRDAYIGRLSQKGLLDVQGAQLYPTDAGREAMDGSFEPLPAGAGLIEYWAARLPEGERKTLEVLIDAQGQDVARDRIDEATGYKRSSRDAYLTRLKARGLVDFTGRGTVKASNELFT